MVSKIGSSAFHLGRRAFDLHRPAFEFGTLLLARGLPLDRGLLMSDRIRVMGLRGCSVLSRRVVE